MPRVLTTGSTLTCAHQGRVTLKASQRQLTVGGRPVLVEGDLNGAAIVGCVTPNLEDGDKQVRLEAARAHLESAREPRARHDGRST